MVTRVIVWLCASHAITSSCVWSTYETADSWAVAVEFSK